MPLLIYNLFLVMLGAAFGGGARYLFTFMESKINMPLQISTLIVNVGGGLLVGLIAGYLLQKPDQGIRLFLIVGFCGGLTTFSSFSLETMMLLQSREYFNALLLISLHLFGAVGATFLGFYLIHKIIGN